MTRSLCTSARAISFGTKATASPAIESTATEPMPATCTVLLTISEVRSTPRVATPTLTFTPSDARSSTHSVARALTSTYLITSTAPLIDSATVSATVAALAAPPTMMTDAMGAAESALASDVASPRRVCAEAKFARAAEEIATATEMNLVAIFFISFLIENCKY